MLANIPEIFISRMRWRLTIPMLPDFGILARRNVDRNGLVLLLAPVTKRLIDFLLIVDAIARKGAKRWIHLLHSR